MGEARPGFLKPISTRSPSVTIEYDVRSGRKERTFTEAYQAKQFYVRMFSQGKNPTIKKETDQ